MPKWMLTTRREKPKVNTTNPRPLTRWCQVFENYEQTTNANAFLESGALRRQMPGARAPVNTPLSRLPEVHARSRHETRRRNGKTCRVASGAHESLGEGASSRSL